jgi:hypothetical protein
MLGQKIDLLGWKLDSLPISQEKLQEANLSKNHWSFSRSNNSIKIVQAVYNRVNGDPLPFSIDSVKYITGRKQVKSVSNGFLIGYNHGEFGGGMKFVSYQNDLNYDIELADPKNEWKYPYVSENVCDIFDFHGNIYATRGLAHMGSKSGGIYQVLFHDTKWKYRFVTELEGKPSISFAHHDHIYIVTTSNVYKFDASEKLTKIIKAPFYWDFLYPKDAFIKDADLYISMRKGVLKIENFEKNPAYQWYVKK